MKAWWIIAVLLAAGLAGCTDDAPEPEAETTEPDTITDPTDYSYVDQNDTGAHLHDYWGGADELEVLWYTKSHNYNNLGGEGSVWTSAFFPPDEHVVPQGTSHLTIMVSWDDSVDAANSYGAMDLWAKPADAAEPRLVQADLENGASVEMPLTYNESDLPHQLISAWEFQVRIHGSPDPGNVFAGTITMQVTAHRGLELKPFPSHPDQWGDNTTIDLAEAEGALFQFRPTGTGDFDHRIRPDDGALVPFGASHVEVTLFYSHSNDVPIGDIEVAFHGADTRNFTILEPESDDGSVRTYRIPVGPTMHDGPYAEASLWEFQVRASTTQPQDGMFDGNYRFLATAHKAP